MERPRMQTVLEDYEVLNTVGAGSFGTCKKIKRKKDGKVFVWKEMHCGSMSERADQRLVSEVNLLCELKHPNIVRYYDHIIDRSRTTIYIVMEYCEGGDLASIITRCRRESAFVEESFVWKVLVQTTMALHECHRRKDGRAVLHRDLKPANIFLDSDNNVKLGDFGLARVLLHETSFAESIVGTPSYMSPELVNNQPYNEKSDVWSLGCTLYELCALRRPFTASNRTELNKQIRAGEFFRIPHRYSTDLNQVISRMIEVQVLHRPNLKQLLSDPHVLLRQAKLGKSPHAAALTHRQEEALRSVQARQKRVGTKEKELAVLKPRIYYKFPDGFEYFSPLVKYLPGTLLREIVNGMGRRMPNFTGSEVLEWKDDPGAITVVFCLVSSNLFRSMKSALQGVVNPGQVVLLLLHPVEQHVTPPQKTADHLLEPPFTDLLAIIDFVFSTKSGLYNFEPPVKEAVQVIAHFFKQQSLIVTESSQGDFQRDVLLCGSGSEVSKEGKKIIETDRPADTSKESSQLHDRETTSHKPMECESASTTTESPAGAPHSVAALTMETPGGEEKVDKANVSLAGPVEFKQTDSPAAERQVRSDSTQYGSERRIVSRSTDSTDNRPTPKMLGSGKQQGTKRLGNDSLVKRKGQCDNVGTIHGGFQDPLGAASKQMSCDRGLSKQPCEVKGTEVSDSDCGSGSEVSKEGNKMIETDRPADTSKESSQLHDRETTSHQPMECESASTTAESPPGVPHSVVSTDETPILENSRSQSCEPSLKVKINVMKKTTEDLRRADDVFLKEVLGMSNHGSQIDLASVTNWQTDPVAMTLVVTDADTCMKTVKSIMRDCNDLTRIVLLIFVPVGENDQIPRSSPKIDAEIGFMDTIEVNYGKDGYYSCHTNYRAVNQLVLLLQRFFSSPQR